jgi:hypothetical protein
MVAVCSDVWAATLQPLFALWSTLMQSSNLLNQSAAPIGSIDMPPLSIFVLMEAELGQELVRR